MIEYDRNDWFGAVFSFRGTALRRAGKRVLFFTLYAILVQAAYELGTSVGGLKLQEYFGLDLRAHAVLGSLLGFLIVFRMNASNTSRRYRTARPTR